MTTDRLPASSSVIGRLLQELSWSGKSIRTYRDGGLGNENVLTAEALQGLDFLPRAWFLGAVIAAAHGASAARARLVDQVDEAAFTLLPGDMCLQASAGADAPPVCVQPDGLIVSPGCYCVLEAKRLRRGSFQTEQLAREFLLAREQAAGRAPLLLLILATEPPVPVQRSGRMYIEDAISAQLGSVLRRCGRPEGEAERLLTEVDDVVAWTTWHELAAVVEAQLAGLPDVEPPIRASITRLVASVTDAIERHG
jgi:hypothetical protein